MISGATVAVIAASGAKTVGILVATGLFMYIGFWAGKKITNKIDELLLVHNKKYIKELESQLLASI